MRDQYYQPPRERGNNRLFSALGLLFAGILAIGLMSKAGIKIDLPGAEKGAGSGLMSASMDDSGASENGGVVVLPPKGEKGTEYDSDFVPKTPRDKPSRSSERTSSGGDVDVEAWIERFSETAVQQAISKGIPAGIALAVGLMEIQSGKSINNWNDFMNRVIKPLAKLKEQSASGDLRSYFKYSANSDRWAQGLDEADLYKATALKKTLSSYDLSAYDHQVKERLAREEEIERQAEYVASEVTTSIRHKSRSAAVEEEKTARPRASNQYEEIVGSEVAKEVARKKLKSGRYLKEEDLSRLVEETDQETAKTLKSKLAFPGRKVNPNHPDATKRLDITDRKNTQAREEVYQKKLKAQREKS
ncbi:MAG: hypothetical protein SGI94_18740 [Saprospiraceae bacterium]|nr:hypothetical protein [Saprospiraceae bacterium]